MSRVVSEPIDEQRVTVAPEKVHIYAAKDEPGRVVVAVPVAEGYFAKAVVGLQDLDDAIDAAAEADVAAPAAPPPLTLEEMNAIREKNGLPPYVPVTDPDAKMLVVASLPVEATETGQAPTENDGPVPEVESTEAETPSLHAPAEVTPEPEAAE